MSKSKLAEYINADAAGARLARLAGELGARELAVVRNLDYLFSPAEIYPLAPRVAPPLERIVAFAVDMDGTSTTTEPLALHALEYMTRRFTGRLDADAWGGLDRALDYPQVIGASNQRHTEFLVARYRDALDPGALRQAFFEALAWTLANMRDPQRRRAVCVTARKCGLADLLADREFRALVGGVDAEDATAAPADGPARAPDVSAAGVHELVRPFLQRFGGAFRTSHTGEIVSAALDVYYFRYHAILQAIEAGRTAELEALLPLPTDAGEGAGGPPAGAGGPGEGAGGSAPADLRVRRQVEDPPHRRLIQPMPGYEVFVPLVKGWLGAEAEAFYEPLRAVLSASRPDIPATRLDAARGRLAALGAHFEREPARLALVTASIAYEAQVVMRAVLRGMAADAPRWPVSAQRRDAIAERLADYRAVFDAFINASHACEHRLKPHPDLYSLALSEMSIAPRDYPCCVGLEDTEPGVIALRAAGIGCAIALPNHDTSRQDYAAATDVLRGGLPELLLLMPLLRWETA